MVDSRNRCRDPRCSGRICEFRYAVRLVHRFVSAPLRGNEVDPRELSATGASGLSLPLPEGGLDGPTMLRTFAAWGDLELGDAERCRRVGACALDARTAAEKEKTRAEKEKARAEKEKARAEKESAEAKKQADHKNRVIERAVGKTKRQAAQRRGSVVLRIRRLP